MKYKLFTLAIAAVTLLGINARAQGTAFTYQGILKQDGAAAYGTYDFRFEPYGSLTGGGPLSPPAYVNGVVVSNGLFTVTIDLGPSVFNGAPRWLEMGVKTNASLEPYTILGRRQEITPAPYAIYARNATSANLVPWSGIQSMPLVFADGIDNDTTYSAGAGLSLSGTTFSLNAAFTDGLYWRLGGNTTIAGQFIGTVNDQPLELRANNVRALRLEPAGGSPNIIGGSPLNGTVGFVGFATIAGGDRNVISNNAQNATIGGGGGNVVYHNSFFATIGGGDRNQINGARATISGGAGNVADQDFSTVVGGANNGASGDSSFVGGGFRNLTLNPYSAVVGGYTNLCGGLNAIVGGGAWNRINYGWGPYAAIVGGSNNTANGFASFVGGGRLNTIAGGEYAVIGGGEGNRANFPHTFIGGGEGNVADGFNAVIAGGRNNQTGEQGAVVGGGSNNDASGHHSTVAGGSANLANGPASFIGGGSANSGFGRNSVTGGGERNSAESDYSTIAGGGYNSIEGLAAGASIGGGRSNNIASAANHSAIAGGFSNRIDAFAAVIAGGARNSVDVDGAWGSIGGGFGNAVDSNMATIGGGWNNTNRTPRGTIAGGRLNLIDSSSEAATIGGGHSNYVQRFARYATIPGGDQNVVWDEHGFAAGHRAKSNHRGAFVWADGTEADHASTRENQFSVRAQGGVTIQSTNIAVELIGGGSVKVAGAGLGSSTPVFVHRATAANISGHTTTIDHPHCNGDPNAILIVTPNWNPSGTGGVYNNSAVGVYYAASRWRIFNQDQITPIAVNAAFNVLVVKP